MNFILPITNDDGEQIVVPAERLPALPRPIGIQTIIGPGPVRYCDLSSPFHIVKPIPPGTRIV